jgi:hypothetical protein
VSFSLKRAWLKERGSVFQVHTDLVPLLQGATSLLATILAFRAGKQTHHIHIVVGSVRIKYTSKES